MRHLAIFPGKSPRSVRLRGALAGVFGIALLAAFAQSLANRLTATSVGVSLVIAEVSDFSINVIAAPEKRIPVTGNDSTRLEIEVRNAGSTTPLFRKIVLTGNYGTYSGLTITDLAPGTYDITAKGYSHLRRKMPSIALSTGATVDFSTGGTVDLLSGDVNSSSGDNLVNGIDLTLIIGDLTGNTERYDLNLDSVVNGIDLTNAITNLTQTGDS